MPPVWSMDRPRAVIHINVADFAVAVERLEDASLRGRPVIMAPQGAARARVFDMSEEAFRVGVRKHMPLARAQRLCREAKIAAPRPHRYERAMAALLRRAAPFSPLVEAEENSGHLFLDLTGTERLFGPPQDVAQRIRCTVRGELGLDPIWGLAANKLVAKVATRVVKPNGEHVVAQGEEEAFLRPLPLFLLPGLERGDLLALRDYHLHRVHQALGWSSEHLAVVFGKRAGQVHDILHGQDDSPVLPLGHKPPVLRLEQELGEDSNRVPEVEAVLWRLVERAGATLRGQGRVARHLVLALDYSDGARVYRQRSHQLGTANDFVLFELTRACLASAWTRRVRIRHLRLSLSRLCFPPPQMELPFSQEDSPPAQGEALLAALDAIPGRHGADKIKVGRGLEAA